MAKQLIPIYFANNDTPLTLITLANTIVDTLATEVVTANASPTGALTTGNAYVSGVLGASVLVGGEIRGGSVDASANLVISSNLIIANTDLYIKVGNTSINSTFVNADSLVVNNATINKFTLNEVTIGNTVISGLTFEANASPNQIFDSFLLASYRSAEYLISMQDTSIGGNSYSLTKILVVHDGTTVHDTEYGIVTSNGNIATINTTANATHLQMLVTPITATNVEIQATRTAMGV